jgi:hypothetical protein
MSSVVTNKIYSKIIKNRFHFIQVAPEDALTEIIRRLFFTTLVILCRPADQHVVRYMCFEVSLQESSFNVD